MGDSHRLKLGQSDLMCRNGCGFYGNPEWNWLCSQCFRKRNSSIQSYNFDAPGSSPNLQLLNQQGSSSNLQLLNQQQGSNSNLQLFSQQQQLSVHLPQQQVSPQQLGLQTSPQPFQSPQQYQSSSLPAPLNKEKSSPFASMMGRSPALDRKLKIPSPQHVAQGLSNKTKIFQSQTLDRSSANIRQIFKKNAQKKEEKSEKSDLVTPETKQVGKEFGEYLSKRVKKSGMEDLSKNIQYFVKKVNKRVDEMKIEDVAAMVQNFYQELTKRLETHENFNGLSQDEIKIIEDFTERYVVISLYKQLFSPVSTNDEEKDLEIQSKIRSLNWVTAAHLECPFKETDPEIRELIYTAINHVLEIDGSKAPQAKLRCVVSCAKTIFQILNKGGTGQGSADDFLPSLIYILLKANPPRVTSNINFITRFTNETRLRSGEEGYYFTNLCCAISFIENLSHESLSLPEDEFQLYMSGECLPPGSWETSLLMCEGIQTMSHNLKTLTDLSQMQDNILRDAKNLEQQIQEWQDTLQSEVDAVLARTQYTIRSPKKPANLDSDVSSDTHSLPPPLLPEALDRAVSPSSLVVDPDVNLPAGGSRIISQESLDSFLSGPGSLGYCDSGASSLVYTSSNTSGQTSLILGSEAGGPPSITGQHRSLIDATPTEEQVVTPLVPVNMSPRSGSPAHSASAYTQPAAEPDHDRSTEANGGGSSVDNDTTAGDAASHLTNKVGLPVNGLASYIGFSAQAVSIPSISCSTAESDLHSLPEHTTSSIPGHTTTSIPGHTTSSIPGHTTTSIPGHTTTSIPGHPTSSISGQPISSTCTSNTNTT